MPDATSLPTAPPDLILHIGTGKTGTTSLQHLFHANRDRLAEAGILYPLTPGQNRHHRLSLFGMPDGRLDRTVVWGREKYVDPARFRRDFRRRLKREIDEAGLPRLLLSDEALYGAPVPSVERVSALMNRLSSRVTVVVYLRRQDDHLASRYQQVVKVGETRRLVERTGALDLSSTYDYFARLQLWNRVLAPDELVVRRFERDSFVRGSLLEDFFEAAGVRVPLDHWSDDQRHNESLDAEAVEFVRLLNICREEFPDLAAGGPRNRPIVQRLAQVLTGPTLTMPAAQLEEFMAKWQESNRRVAESFLGDESGVLFRQPRKERNTTSEQYLDPARLDELLGVVELPEQLHEPMRRVAEREARTYESALSERGSS